MKFSKQEQVLMKKDNSLKKLIISNKHINVSKPQKIIMTPSLIW